MLERSWIKSVQSTKIYENNFGASPRLNRDELSTKLFHMIIARDNLGLPMEGKELT